jgi:pyrroline-5-carboxylate reductase
MEHKLGKIAVLGMGKMGGILVRAFQKQKLFAARDIAATVQHEEKAAALSVELGIPVSTNNRKAVHKADIILLGLKPSAVGGVLDEIRSELNPKQLIISIAASVPTEYVEKRLAAPIPVVRTMPNTPAIVGCGITAICKGKYVHEKHLDTASRLFASIGRTVTVDEKHMDAITGLSASGPAYIYIILEALAEGGVKVGLPRDLATLLAAQTTLGAAKVALETGHHPALLKDEVTTPAGCTIDGILELEEGKLRVTLIKAVVKAAQRARELLFKDSAVGA